MSTQKATAAKCIRRRQKVRPELENYNARSKAMKKDKGTLLRKKRNEVIG